MNKILIIVLIASASFLGSCKKNHPDPGGTAAQSMANEWWVTLSQGGVDLTGHEHFLTYNTAANNNQMFLDDGGHLWDFKCKTTADFSALTFSATGAQNEYYNITVDVRNGKVIPNVGRSKTGNVVDSIYMQVEFSDDPGIVYEIKGHARTRFVEDEY